MLLFVKFVMHLSDSLLNLNYCSFKGQLKLWSQHFDYWPIVYMYEIVNN